MNPAEYMEKKAYMARKLSRSLEENMDDYLAKVAEGYPEDVRAMAKCALGRRLTHCRGTCFALPPIEEV